MVYLMIDTMVRPSNPGHGFANTKAAIAFTDKQTREKFISSREDFDYSMRIISRKEALKNLVSISFQNRDKGLPLDQEDLCFDFVVLRSSKY